MAKRALVIGSGPNGLSAAIVLAQSGYAVEVREQAAAIGGAARTAQLTLPGFRHDLCSAIFPLGAGSPFFRSLPLHQYGLEWIHPEVPLAHSLDDGSAVILERSVDTTAAGLGADGPAYAAWVRPFVERWQELAEDFLAPLRLPRHALLAARFGKDAIRSARSVIERRFAGERARALLAGMAAHSMMPLEKAPTAGFAMVLAITGHAVGWPMARGGAGTITQALGAHLRSLGGEIHTSAKVQSLDEAQGFDLVMCDITPRQLLQLAGIRLPQVFRDGLRHYRYGPGAYKLDWALDGPIPWTAKECARAGTVHLGGTLEECAASERAAWRGRHAERPFVLLAQQSLFDASRAPTGKHTAWAYCHVPNGSNLPMQEKIEAQIERFAPGFRQRILARSVRGPRELEAGNPNLVGGDINGGASMLSQMFFRPSPRLYGTPLKNVFLCSSSTPPGGGVHGMCGYWAAQAAMKKLKISD